MMTPKERNMNKQRLIVISVVPAMVLPFIASFFYFIVWADQPVARYLYSAVKLFTLIWPVLALFLVIGEKDAFRGILGAGHLCSVPLGILTGCVIGGLILAGYYLTPLGEHVNAHKDAIVQQMEKFNLVKYYIPFAVFLSLAHSLIEEYYWRWFVFGQLAKIVPAAAAYLLGSAAFAAHHFVVLSVYFPAWSTALFGTGVGLGGLLWCWQYRKQKSLAGAWVSHMLVDASFLFIGYQLMTG